MAALIWEVDLISVFLPHHHRASQLKMKLFSQSNQHMASSICPGTRPGTGGSSAQIEMIYFSRHSFNNYLLSVYWGPDPGLGARKAEIDKTQSLPCNLMVKNMSWGGAGEGFKSQTYLLVAN